MLIASADIRTLTPRLPALALYLVYVMYAKSLRPHQLAYAYPLARRLWAKHGLMHLHMREQAVLPLLELVSWLTASSLSPYQ
jgi:hypothetical protein